MPTRTVVEPFVARTHSCSAVYFSSSGTSDMHAPSCLRCDGPTLPTPGRARSSARVGVLRCGQPAGGRDRYRIVFGDGELAAGGTDRRGDPAEQVQSGVECL